jgi:putative membrane protein
MIVSSWAAVAALIGGGAAFLAVAPLGPLTRHMGAHILLMNVVAPALAIALMLSVRTVEQLPLRRTLAIACGAQIFLLWAAHAPGAIVAAMHRPAVAVAVQASMLAGSLWFWLSVFAQRGPQRWRAIVALLLTGKLFCLLAVLIVFAPRFLYSAHAPLGVESSDPLSDQQLAGLLMLVICPLTYVVAGVVSAERWLREVSRGNETSARWPTAAK